VIIIESFKRLFKRMYLI